MDDQEKLEKFVQELYLTRFGRRVDDITDSDGVEEIEKSVIWINSFLDELELESDWQYVRENDAELGTASEGSQSVELDDDVNKLVVAEHRPLLIVQNGSVVSRWDVVDPNQITSRDGSMSDNRVTTVNNAIVFSRPFNETEIDGTVVADIINYIPRVSNEENNINVEALDLVKPRQLLLLGAAKNATLPDIVQGGLSPSFTQKYADLLTKAIAKNEASTVANDAIREDFGYIGGIY